MSSGTPILEWVKGLEALPVDEFDEHVGPYLKTRLISRESLDPYAFFNQNHYTRNLIFKNDLFEVMALCWEAGHVSRLHNHRDQRCWMAMADGRLENVSYEVWDRDPAAGTCKMKPSTTTLITRESPMVVDDEHPVHQVVNCPDFGRRALSVHIYSRPFDTCEIYDTSAGTYKDVKLSYWSEYGKVCASD